MKAHLTHFQQEIFQAAWLILIQDPEFLKAYVNGIIVNCIDGVRRQLFPRFFVYAADYPEKYVTSFSAQPLDSHVVGPWLLPFVTMGCTHALGVWFERRISSKSAGKMIGVPAMSYDEQIPLNGKTGLGGPG